MIGHGTSLLLHGFLGVLLLLGIPGCSPSLVDESPTEGFEADETRVDVNETDRGVEDKLTQISVINALMLGQYDGLLSIGDLLRYGGFGLGTLDHLDGELIVLEGRAYQVTGNGDVVEVSPDRTTPFAVVTHFQPDGDFDIVNLTSLTELDHLLDERIGHRNNFIAIRVDGHVASLTVRSVQRQEPPYRPLAAVAKSQGEWTHHDLRGTLVGIRCPPWVEGLNVPGYHWHFISEDRKVGGHVLACHLREAHVQYDPCTSWQIQLPGGEQFNSLDLGEDLRKELKAVERSRSDEPGR